DRLGDGDQALPLIGELGPAHLQLLQLLRQGFDGSGREDERFGGSEVRITAEAHAHASECASILKLLPVPAAHHLADGAVAPIVDGLVPVPAGLGSPVVEERHHGPGGGSEHDDVALQVRLRWANDDLQSPRNLMIGFVPAHVLSQMLAPTRTSQVRSSTPNLITSPPMSYS